MAAGIGSDSWRDEAPPPIDPYELHQLVVAVYVVASIREISLITTEAVVDDQNDVLLTATVRSRPGQDYVCGSLTLSRASLTDPGAAAEELLRPLL